MTVLARWATLRSLDTFCFAKHSRPRANGQGATSFLAMTY